MSATRYEVLVADPWEDRARILTMWATGGFSQDADENSARYDWFYLENPQGEAKAYLLTVAGEQTPAGVMALVPRHFHVGGTKVDAGIMVDFVVGPDHRTLLPALTLQRRSRSDALPTMPVLMGIPNEKSRGVCLRAGADLRLEVSEYCRALRTRTYLERSIPGVLAPWLAPLLDWLGLLQLKLRLIVGRQRCEWTDEFGTEFDGLWSRVDKAGRCIGMRDSSFLTWRFSRHPSRRYRTLTVRTRDTEELLGYFVCERVNEALVVKDWLWSGDRTGLTRALLLLTAAAFKQGVSVIRLHTAPSPENAQALRNAQFLKRGKRLLIAVLCDSLKEDATRLNWHITQADEDV